MDQESGGEEGAKEVWDNIKQTKEFDQLEKIGRSMTTIGSARVMDIKRK